MKSCRVCKEKHYAKGLCQFHYQRQWKGIPFARPKGAHEQKYCRIDGCSRKHFGLGLCGLHYQRLHRGSPFEDVDFRGETYRRKSAMAQLPDDIKEAYGA